MNQQRLEKQPQVRVKKKKKGNDGSPSSARHCTLYAQWSPGIKNTHNTADCRKWNTDGTPKNKGKANRNNRSRLMPVQRKRLTGITQVQNNRSVPDENDYKNNVKS